MASRPTSRLGPSPPIGAQPDVAVTSAELTAGATAMQEAVARARIADERAAAAVREVQARLAGMAADAPDGGPAAVAPAPAAPTEEPGAASIIGHTLLDVVGLVPVVGEAADVANAAWYGLEGDHVAAGLSLAAAIPIAGWLFTGGKLGVKGAKMVTDAGGAKAWATGQPSMVPVRAERLPYKGGGGEKYQWKDGATGKNVEYHAHGADPRSPAGSNAARGPVYRIKLGNNHWLDAQGNRYTKNQVERPTSPVYSEKVVNDTHIPYPTNQPAPGQGAARAFVPNPSALVQNEETEGRDR